MTIVYRIEHRGCHEQNHIHHGPHGNDATCSGWSTAPPFGSNGPVPSLDSPPLPITDGMRCGVLRQQVRAWWSFEDSSPLVKPNDWDFAVYLVDRMNLNVGERQVTFWPADARFLGYFPGWVGSSGELDDRWPDEFFHAEPALLTASYYLESRFTLDAKAS